MSKDRSRVEMTDLRRRAEARLQERRTPSALTEVEGQRLIHELQVHQIELELQNEELRETHDRLEQNLERYADLYDFAPMGHFILAGDGTIQELNLAGAALLGQERSRLVGQQLRSFVSVDSQPRFDAFLDRVLRGTVKENGEVIFAAKDAPPRCVHLTGMSMESGAERWGRLAALDITERREAESRLTEYTGRLRQLSQRLLSIQEEERRALARELEDGFGQQLAALKLNLGVLGRGLKDTASQHYLVDCFEIADLLLEHSRDTARNLRPDVLDDLGLSHALHWYARRQTERTDCEIEVQDRLPSLPSEIETAVFRIVQEAVDNAIRHGGARRITIAAEVGGQRLALIVQDDGSGFSPEWVFASRETGVGLGLLGMRERAEWLGGRFALVSRPGAGTRVEVTIPLLEVPS